MVSALVAVIGAACTVGPTQLVVVVSTDVPSGYTCVRAEVNEIDGPNGPTDRAFQTPGEVSLPFSFGIAPADPRSTARVEIAVELRDDRCEARVVGEARPLVRRVVRTRYLPEQSLRVPVFLGARCVTQVCADGLTCDPASGSCVPITETDPATLTRAIPGRELEEPATDAGLDAITIDAAGLDAAGPDASAIDAGARDTGTPRDTALPDAGPTCATVATVVGTAEGAGPLNAFALAGHPDGVTGLRGMTVTGSSADWAGAADLSGTSVGSATFPPPGSARGPVAISYSQDGTARAFIYRLFGGSTMQALFAMGEERGLPGACAGSRCMTGLGADLAVLLGTTDLSLARASISPLARGARITLTAPVSVVTGASEGGVRTATAGLLVTYTRGGACFVEHWPDLTGSAARLEVSSCASLDVAQLDSGLVGLVWIDDANAVHAGIANGTLAGLITSTVVDDVQASRRPAFATPTRSGFRATWVDDTVPQVLSATMDGTGSITTRDCAAAAGQGLTEYERLQVVRRGNTTAAEWYLTRDFYGATWAD